MQERAWSTSTSTSRRASQHALHSVQFFFGIRYVAALAAPGNLLVRSGATHMLQPVGYQPVHNPDAHAAAPRGNQSRCRVYCFIVSIAMKLGTELGDDCF